VATPMGVLRFVTPRWLARHYGGAGELPEVAPPWPAAMTIEVGDLDRAAGVLARRGVAFHSRETSLVLPAAATGGTILELVASADGDAAVDGDGRAARAREGRLRRPRHDEGGDAAMAHLARHHHPEHQYGVGLGQDKGGGRPP